MHKRIFPGPLIAFEAVATCARPLWSIFKATISNRIFFFPSGCIAHLQLTRGPVAFPGGPEPPLCGTTAAWEAGVREAVHSATTPAFPVPSSVRPLVCAVLGAGR